jgi:hypothetical protein
VDHLVSSAGVGRMQVNGPGAHKSQGWPIFWPNFETLMAIFGQTAGPASDHPTTFLRFASPHSVFTHEFWASSVNLALGLHRSYGGQPLNPGCGAPASQPRRPCLCPSTVMSDHTRVARGLHRIKRGCTATRVQSFMDVDVESFDLMMAVNIRARSHCRFVRPPIHFIPDSLTYSVPLFLRRQGDRTLGQLPSRAADVAAGGPRAHRSQGRAHSGHRLRNERADR